METILDWLLAAVTLAVGLFLTIKPEKATWDGKTTKTRTRIMRIVGIVILALLAVAAFAYFMALKEGQITL